MKSIVFATAGLLLFLATSPTAAEDTQPSVSAAMTVYSYILETEAIIGMCGHVDIVNATSYHRVYKRYEDEISQTVIRIGFLVGQELRRAGVDEQAIWKALDAITDSTVQATERMARMNPERFTLGSRALPNAIIEKKKPFEPFATRFPQEMEVIQNRP